MWRDYTNNELDFFIANVGNTISENQDLISRIRDTITIWHRRAEQAQNDDERARLYDAIGSMRNEIESLSDQARRLIGNKRAATREWERRSNNDR